MKKLLLVIIVLLHTVTISFAANYQHKRIAPNHQADKKAAKYKDRQKKLQKKQAELKKALKKEEKNNFGSDGRLEDLSKRNKLKQKLNDKKMRAMKSLDYRGANASSNQMAKKPSSQKIIKDLEKIPKKRLTKDEQNTKNKRDLAKSEKEIKRLRDSGKNVEADKKLVKYLDKKKTTDNLDKEINRGNKSLRIN